MSAEAGREYRNDKMGWFEEQIKDRIRKDDDVFADACARMSQAVGAKGDTAGILNADRMYAERAVGEIMDYYHINGRDVPGHVKTMDDMLEYLLRPAGIMRRGVKLTEGWYRDAVGAMLATTREGHIVALLPGAFRGYAYRNPADGRLLRVNGTSAQGIEEAAVCFYKPFPLKPISIGALIRYLFELLHPGDYLWMGLLSLFLTMLGAAVPALNRFLYGEVVAYGDSGILTAAVLVLLCMNLSGRLFGVVQSVANAGIQARMELSAQSAVMMRILSLPPEFFKKYSSGELAGRAECVKPLCSRLFQAVFVSGLTALCSLLYIGQISLYAPVLMLPALTVTLIIVILSVAAALLQGKVMEKQMVEESRENGIVHGLMNGIVKIKSSGAEKRAFAKWGGQYARVAKQRYNPPIFLKINSVLAMAVTLFGAAATYWFALKGEVTVADYVAFGSAYGMINGAFTALGRAIVSIAGVRPMVNMLSPILEAQPEISEEKPVAGRLTGSIELSNVSFRYQESMPLVLDNLSLKIRAGQYIAIVGKTGCGKSTLMRILLGFEKPAKGAVYYDGKDLNSMDLKSLRQKIGVVMQDGKLFQGDIFSNITISSPLLTLEEAWEAAELAGMAEDIRNMPMRMNTLISEGAGGISGGQRQRLMIARAVASRPRILMFDEATSALDNVTQKMVSDALERLKCTRIVIAHRLSTIRRCDRIIVLEQGRIAEEGTYEELMARQGAFARLAERQIV